MPEIWLNYGQNEVVLDIQAENLNEKPTDESQTIDESSGSSKSRRSYWKNRSINSKESRIEKNKSGGAS